MNKSQLLMVFGLVCYVGVLIMLHKQDDHLKTRCIDVFKDGDIVEAVGGNFKGWIGYCKHTDSKYYDDGKRLVIFKVNPLGNQDNIETGFVSFCDLTKTARWAPNYTLPIN